MLKSKFVDSNDDFPKDTLDILAENAASNTDNMTILESVDNELCSLQAIDDLPKNVH